MNDPKNPEIGERIGFVTQRRIGKSIEFTKNEGTVKKTRTVRQAYVIDDKKKGHWIDLEEVPAVPGATT